MEKDKLLQQIDAINLQFHRELELIFKAQVPGDPQGSLSDLPGERTVTISELRNAVMILWNNTVQMVKTLMIDGKTGD